MSHQPTSSSHSTSLASPAQSPGLSADKQQYLRLLSIAHYVLAGLSFVFGFFPMIHFGFGLAMLGGFASPSGEFSDGTPERLVGCLFASIGFLFIAWAWAYAYFMVVAGKALAARRRHTLCLVMAALSCMFAPLGTVVGIFALVLLLNDEVKAEFDRSVSG